MPMPRCLMIVLCLAALCGRALGEAPTAPAAAPVDPMARVIADVNFQSVSLDDALDFLQGIAPDFKAVVVRDKGVPQDYPTMKIKLKNVSLGQVWSVLQAANPDLEVQPVGENEGPTPIYLIRVKASSNVASPEGAGAVPAVHVYPLGPLLDAMAAKAGNQAAHGGDPLDRVLSLIKATLAQVSDGGEPVLQVHEGTRTLIFKGSAEQEAALEQVLSALAPASAEEAAGNKRNNEDLQQQIELAKTQAAMQAQKLEADLAELHQRLAEEEKNSLDRTAEAERLKVRLEEQTDRMNDLKRRLAEQTDELTKQKDQAAH